MKHHFIFAIFLPIFPQDPLTWRHIEIQGSVKMLMESFCQSESKIHKIALLQYQNEVFFYPHLYIMLDTMYTLFIGFDLEQKNGERSTRETLPYKLVNNFKLQFPIGNVSHRIIHEIHV